MDVALDICPISRILVRRFSNMRVKNSYDC